MNSTYYNLFVLLIYVMKAIIFRKCRTDTNDRQSHYKFTKQDIIHSYTKILLLF